MSLASFRHRLFGRVSTQQSASSNETEAPSSPLETNASLIGNKDPIAIQHQPTDTTSDPEQGQEKLSTGQDNQGREVSDDDPVLKDIPWHVRRVISLHDDPTLPTITFRYFLLSILFVAPGAFLGQLSSFRTTYAPYSVFFVQIASNYVGVWLAKILPAKFVRIPFTKWGFSLNPGPFSVKEHVLVTISAASGATYNLGYTPIAMSELYFGQPVHPAIAIFFMWAIVWTGYSFAAVARQFLLYDPQYPWFQALCQTALFETQKKQREFPTALSRRQMIVFWAAFLGVALWQFLPEYVFPFLGSLAFLCWVAPHNPTANFIGSGFGGMGFLNLSLDWSNVSSLSNSGSIFLTPFWTQLIIFSAFFFNCWVLLPASKWGGLGGATSDFLMSNRVFTESGDPYPLTSLVTPQATLNQTAYAENGPIFVGTQYLWNMFFDYASYTSALTWAAVFGWPQIRDAFLKLRAARRVKHESINHQYGDQLNVLQRSYKEIPFWWYFVLFLASFVIMVTIIATGNMFIPIWTYFIALATGVLVVIPLGWLYALSNFQLPIGTFNELIYGVMVNGVSGFKNPAGASTYSAIAGDAWYRAQLMLQDQKIGHYMHIPPRAVFFSQVFGSFIGVPINYGVIKWVVSSKGDYLRGTKEDPSHQWTGQTLASSLTMGVQYVLIGPTRLFEQHIFKVVPYGFLFGGLAPIVLYFLSRLFPRAKFHLWNTTIFCSAMSTFYGNISTGYFSSIIGGFVIMFWAYRYRYQLWSRYNYVLAAAFDAGFNLNLLLIFLIFGSGKVISMPHWWGNNADSSERCFALDS